MTQKTARLSHLSKALLETAADMRRVGILSEAAHQKITARHLGLAANVKVPPMGPNQIRSIREKARMSQTVFARHLNVTAGYVSQLERGVKKPTGPALALLNVISKKGIEVVL